MNKAILADGTSIQYGAVKRYTIPMKPETADQQVDRETKALMAQTGRTYSQALGVVLTINPELKKAWVRETLGRARR